MFIAGLVKMLPVARTATPGQEIIRPAREAARSAPAAGYLADEANCYDQLIHSVFRPADQKQQTGKVIAFTSASAGAGTSFVLQEIGDELACYDDKKTLIIEAKKLQTCAKAELEKWLKLRAITDANLSFLKAEDEQTKHGKSPAALSKSQKKALARRNRAASPADNLKLLSSHFDYILVDCQPAKASNEMLLLAKLVDGVVIVAAAGQTRRDEIQRSQQVIEVSEGKVLGFVLNKRRYPVPDWLYRKI